MHDNKYKKIMHFWQAENKGIFHAALVQSWNTSADYKKYAVKIVNKCL